MPKKTIGVTLIRDMPTKTTKEKKVSNTLFGTGMKKLILSLTPDSLEDLVKTIGHEAESLVNYGRFGMFSSIAIETTSICNRKCSYCPVSETELYQGRGPKPMSNETYKNTIDQLAFMEYKGKIALQHYGEPLLDNKLASRVAYARKQLPNATILMNSNGDFLTPEKFQELVISGMDLIHVTNHNQDGTVHPNLAAFQEWIAGHPEIKSHFKMRSGVTTYYNRGGLVNVENARRMQHCVDESYSANVDADGNVVLCANDYTGIHRYGNVNERTISSIWYDPSFRELRLNKTRGNFELDICKKCVGEK